MPPNTFTLTEYPNNKYIKNVWTHPSIWSAQRDDVKNYCNLYKEDGIVIEYIKYNKYGRYFVKNHKVSSSTIMWCPIRSCLFGETEYDVDIINCHSNLLLDICEPIDFYQIECLKYYCTNRDGVIDMFNIKEEQIIYYNNQSKNKNDKKDIVKNLITRVLYGGSVEEWKKEFFLEDIKIPQFVEKFIEEIKTNTNLIVNDKRFKDLVDYERQRRIEKQKKKRGESFDFEQFDVKPSKFLSVILQEYETLIIMKVIDFVKSYGVQVTSYNYDGFQIRKETIDDCEAFGSCEEFVTALNKLEHSVSHNNKKSIDFHHIKFVIKPFKDPLDTTELINFDTDNFEEEVFNKIEAEDYDTKKNYFEKYFAKIKTPTQFVEMKKNDYHLFAKKDFMDSYQHLRYSKFNDHLKRYVDAGFVNDWLKDKTMRYFDKVDYYPTHSMCPKKTFNLWTDFPIKNITLDKNADTSLLYKHIEILLNYNTIDIEWLLNWMAHIVQFPHKKTEVCVILYDKKFGTGKSILAEEFLKPIIGLNKMKITAKTDKLFGKFTDTQGKLLYVLNEAKGKDTFELNDIIKDAITGKVGEMEKKRMDAIQVIDYINYMVTTNNLNSIKLEEGDRRFMVFKTNGELKGNVEYFDKLMEALGDEVIMRKFYVDLMERDLSNYNPSRDRQNNNLMDIMKEHNQDFTLEFIKYWKEECPNCDNVFKTKMKAMDLYDEFKKYYERCGMNNNSRPSLTSFGTKLKTYDEHVSYNRNGSGVYYYLM